jgi:excisionase family DNA binding protein
MSAALLDSCSARALVVNEVRTESCRPERAPLPPKARRIADACAALGISRSTLYKLAAQGKVKLVKISGRSVVPEIEIDRLASGGSA